MADPVDLNVVFKKVQDQEPLNQEEHQALIDAWTGVEDNETKGQTITSPDGNVTLGEPSDDNLRNDSSNIETAIQRGTEEQFVEKLMDSIPENGSKGYGKAYKKDQTPLTRKELKNIYNSLSPEGKKKAYKNYIGLGARGAINKTMETSANEIAESGVGYFFDDTPEQQKAKEQAALDGNANQPAASPSSEDDDDKKNDTLGEGNGNLFQCYLLNGVSQITNEMNSYNDGTYADRLRRVRLDRPEKFFNTLGFPKSGEELYKSASGFNDQSSFKFYLVKNGEKLDIIESLNRQTTQTRPEITSLDISFNGTNPASARSDVKVEININMKANLAILDQKFDTPVLHNGEVSTKDWKIIDLVVRPEFIREGGDISAYERSQYHPEYNRCELVLTSMFANNSCVIKNSVSFGLTMVDHELDYSITPAEGAVTKLRLTYFSYVQSYLNLPYMDVLGGKKILANRRSREVAIQNAVREGCDEASIHRAKKTMKIANREEIQLAKTRIFDELKENGLIWRTDVSDTELERVRKETERGEIGFDGNKLDSNASIENDANSQGSIDKETLDYTTGEGGDAKKYIYFVSLGDLICSLSDLFYVNEYKSGGNTSEYDPNFKGKLEIKFLLLDILVKNQEGDDVQINLADIPISMEWLGDFLLENYFKKEVQYASFMPFLRNLIEKAVSNMLKKTCFMEKPWTGNVRVTSFRALKTSWDKLKKFSTLSSAQYQANNYVPGSQMKHVGAQMGAIGKTEDDYYTYIIVHASNQNYQSDLIKSVSSRQSEVEKEFPILRDAGVAKTNIGTDEKPVYGTDVGCFFSFKKTDSAGLRESRYFQYQADEFVAIGNVYDCTVNFKNNLLNWFIPGHVLILDPYCGDSKTWNNSKSIGNRIGLTGFYLVTKVQHKYESTNKNYNTTLQTKWIASVTGNIRGRKGTVENINKGPRQCDVNIFADDPATSVTPSKPVEEKAITTTASEVPTNSSSPKCDPKSLEELTEEQKLQAEREKRLDD